MGTGHFGNGRCKYHGGATPSHEKKGAEELIRQGRGDLWYGDPINVDPHEALLEEVYRTHGHVAYLQLELATIELVDVEGDDRVHKIQRLQALYNAEREHLTKVCQVALNAGIEERRVAVAERYGAAIAELISGILEDLKLSDKQKKAAPKVVKKRLQLVSSNGQTVAA